MLVRNQGTLQELVQELKPEVTFLAQHLFRADWQSKQFEAMRKSRPFPARTVGMVLDFAENFTCTHQDEVQAAHWHHEQVTVHPIVSYYGCQECQETVTESLVFVSDDKVHDHNAVFHFTKLAMEHLQLTRGLSLKTIIQWTDGCCSQYKSKGPFSDISCALGDFNCTLERHFFGSRHGKGPSDGESAVIKHHAAMAVKSGNTIIAGAKDLFDYCFSSKLNKQPAHECDHFRRSFFWVAAGEVRRDRNRTVKTLKGTRALHTVKCVEQNMLCTRHLSCMCCSCQTGTGECANAAIAGPWTAEALRPQPVHHQPAVHVADDDQEPGDQPAQELGNQPTVQQPVLHQPAVQVADDDQEPGDQPAVQQPVPHQPAPAVGDFVKAKVKGRHRNVIFFAKVLDVDKASGDLKLHYLTQKPGSADIFVWADESWLPKEQITKIVRPPILAPTRGIAFTFQ